MLCLEPSVVLSWLLLVFTDSPCSWIKLTRLVNSLLLYLTSWAALNLARMKRRFHVLLGKGECTTECSSIIAWGRGSQSQLRCQAKGIEKVPRRLLPPPLLVWLSHWSERGFFCHVWASQRLMCSQSLFKADSITGIKTDLLVPVHWFNPLFLAI